MKQKHDCDDEEDEEEWEEYIRKTKVVDEEMQ